MCQSLLLIALEPSIQAKTPLEEAPCREARATVFHTPCGKGSTEELVDELHFVRMVDCHRLHPPLVDLLRLLQNLGSWVDLARPRRTKQICRADSVRFAVGGLAVVDELPAS